MGREFGSASARWCHLPGMDVRPEIVAVCDMNPSLTRWFAENFPSVKQVTSEYQTLLANPEVEAVYIAVPHNLHAEFYCAAIKAGKHLMGEKPFGIDLEANRQIRDCIRRHPGVFVRCSSESPFFPAMQQIGAMIEQGAFGRLIEVNSGFLHSSDMDANKPINWKRLLKFNGEYGCMAIWACTPATCPSGPAGFRRMFARYSPTSCPNVPTARAAKPPVRRGTTRRYYVPRRIVTAASFH